MEKINGITHAPNGCDPFISEKFIYYYTSECGVYGKKERHNENQFQWKVFAPGPCGEHHDDAANSNQVKYAMFGYAIFPFGEENIRE